MKRFYREVRIEEADGGFRVTLDERPLRTRGGKPQVVPTRALAEALAEEWRAQGDTIDPRSLPLRDHADHAIDHVAPDRDGAIARALRFAESDTLCYRADPEEPLHARQLEVWEPILQSLEARAAIRFERVCGIVHRAQPIETLDALRAMLAPHNAFTLAGIEAMASLAASLAIALEALERPERAEELWRAAILEEEWQAELWGRDEEAEASRARRAEQFARAHRFACLARG